MTDVVQTVSLRVQNFYTASTYLKYPQFTLCSKCSLCLITYTPKTTPPAKNSVILTQKNLQPHNLNLQINDILLPIYLEGKFLDLHSIAGSLANNTTHTHTQKKLQKTLSMPRTYWRSWIINDIGLNVYKVIKHPRTNSKILPSYHTESIPYVPNRQPSNINRNSYSPKPSRTLSNPLFH